MGARRVDGVTEVTGETIDAGGAAQRLAAFGVRRAVIAVSPSLADREILADVVRGFGSSGVSLVATTTARPIGGDADGIVSLGGGSTIRAGREYAGSLPGARHVAIPTTTSCVEQFGDDGAPRPDAVFFDALGILGVPLQLQAAHAFNAMTFAFAAVCENDIPQSAVTMALESVRGLRRGLQLAAAGAELDRASALEMLQAAARAGAASRSARSSIARSIGEALHDRSEIPYAMCVALVLPFTLAYLRRARADRIALFAPVFEHAEDQNVIDAADAVIAAIRNLGQNAGIPRNFRAAGLSREAMEGAAKSVPQMPAAEHFIRPFESAEQVMNELFRFAW
jgi:alcohol dehydrogenase class IV